MFSVSALARYLYVNRILGRYGMKIMYLCRYVPTYEDELNFNVMFHLSFPFQLCNIENGFEGLPGANKLGVT